MELNSKQTRHLRRLAHHLDAVVIVGDRGMTSEVIRATDEALNSHELIKVRIRGDRIDVKGHANTLRTELGAALVQIIGKIAILYRKREKKPKIELPT